MLAARLLQKYGEIIAEEVNVKDVTLLDDTVSVTVTYIPLGQKIGGLFGKDTSAVIAAAKAGDAILQADGSLLVNAGDNSWTLTPDMYEIRYSGLEEDHQTIEGGVIVSLDMTITEELKKEGVARELSRFLNQMRKDAQFQIDEKVMCFYHTDDGYMRDVLNQFNDMLLEEALLKKIDFDNDIYVSSKSTTTYASEEGSVTFYLSNN